MSFLLGREISISTKMDDIRLLLLFLTITIPPAVLSEHPQGESYIFTKYQSTKINRSTLSSIIQSLDHLTLRDNGIEEIEPQSFERFYRLKNLEIEGNTLTNLQPGVFEGLDQLEELSIRNEMKLMTLIPDTFTGLKNLKRLNLIENNIANLSLGAFKGLTNLKTINLSRNSLTDLQPDIFEGLDQLEELFINDEKKKLADFNRGTFNGLKKLQHLSFIHINSSHLKRGVFDGLTNLKSLEISGHDMTNLQPGIFKGLQQLEKLDIHDKKKQTSSIRNRDRDTLIYIGEGKTGARILNDGKPLKRYNQSSSNSSRNPLPLSMIPSDFKVDVSDKISNLKATNTSANNLTDFQSEIPRKLDEVNNMGRDTLIYIGEGKTGARILNDGKPLKRYNQSSSNSSRNPLPLSMIPSDSKVDVSDKISNLKATNTSANNSTDLQSGISRALDKIEKVNINHQGKTRTLDKDTFYGLKNLIRLSLSWNGLTHLKPGTFHGLRQLKFRGKQDPVVLPIYSHWYAELFNGTNRQGKNHFDLHLDNNEITIIENNTFAGTHCTDLNLHNNKIAEIIPGAFSGLMVWNLNLSNNRLATIKSGTFQGIVDIRVLDLSKNLLTHLEPGFFNGIIDLTNVHLDFKLENSQTNTIKDSTVKELEPKIFNLHYDYIAEDMKKWDNIREQLTNNNKPSHESHTYPTSQSPFSTATIFEPTKIIVLVAVMLRNIIG